MKDSIECTLLELLETLNDVTDNDHEVAATVASLVNSGRVRLTGNFAGARIDMQKSFGVFPESLWPALLSLHSASARMQQVETPMGLGAGLGPVRRNALSCTTSRISLAGWH